MNEFQGLFLTGDNHSIQYRTTCHGLCCSLGNHGHRAAIAHGCYDCAAASIDKTDDPSLIIGFNVGDSKRAHDHS